ncbi:MAG: ABC transporter ATP-binding protein [Pseudomonadota bacterium]|nr:ABC transporter ATP-binding protein [Pseudomonadota bacterium]
MLRLTGIGRRFPGGVEALRDVSLDIAERDFVALLGPSGCGKSTLLRLIAGLDAPDAGTLDWAGGSAPMPGQIGFVFQDPTLLPWATAEENVFLPLRLGGFGRARAMDDVRTALARVGLAGFERARPRLLLMDEPFAALDEFTRHKLQADLLALWQTLGCTVVFVTHSIYEASFLARRIVLMTPRPGRIAREIASPLRPEAETRLDPAYTALVAEVTRAMAGVLAA